MPHTTSKPKGCLYWLILGWWLEPVLLVFYRIPKRLLFGKPKQQHSFSVKTPQPTSLTEIELLQIKNALQQVADCAHLTHSTVNPDIFFARLHFLFDILLYLKKYEGSVPLGDFIPSAEYSELFDNLDGIVNNFIDRAIADNENKIAELKTAKGQSARTERFYNQLLDTFHSAYTLHKPNQLYPHYTGELFTAENLKRVVLLTSSNDEIDIDFYDDDIDVALPQAEYDEFMQSEAHQFCEQYSVTKDEALLITNFEIDHERRIQQLTDKCEQYIFAMDKFEQFCRCVDELESFCNSHGRIGALYFAQKHSQDKERMAIWISERTYWDTLLHSVEEFIQTNSPVLQTALWAEFPRGTSSAKQHVKTLEAQGKISRERHGRTYLITWICD